MLSIVVGAFYVLNKFIVLLLNMYFLIVELGYEHYVFQFHFDLSFAFIYLFPWLGVGVGLAVV